MNIFKRFWCRTYQTGFRLLLPFLPYRQPKMLEKKEQLVCVLNEHKKKKVFFVTDQKIRGLGLTAQLEDEILAANIGVVVFDEVLPNPTISMIEKARELYAKENCDAIVALGGGSVIDLAKAVGARIARPNKSISQMKGLLKVRKKLPLLVAIPTTAGTGSETTLAAVVTDDKTHHKYSINDFSLIPNYALLDYNLTLGLNPFITCTTGMDALTHAVEAYIGKSTTPKTRAASEEAVKLVYENLKKAYTNGEDKQARQNMLKASFLAGVAFTKSYVGYVHAIAHSLGGEYGIAHGLANAVILPVVLREFGKSAQKKLAKLARKSGICNDKNDAVASEKFVEWIEELQQFFGLPKQFEQIKEEDISKMAQRAAAEANPLYPVPKLFDKTELATIYKKLMTE